MESPYTSNVMKGMRAIVCGASKGIGRATAEMLASSGADVIGLSRSAPNIEGVRSLSVDLENQVAIENVITEILNEGAVHILINNASGPPGGPLLNNEIEDFIAPFQRHLHKIHLWCVSLKIIRAN